MHVGVEDEGDGKAPWAKETAGARSQWRANWVPVGSAHGGVQGGRQAVGGLVKPTKGTGTFLPNEEPHEG